MVVMVMTATSDLETNQPWGLIVTRKPERHYINSGVVVFILANAFVDLGRLKSVSIANLSL